MNNKKKERNKESKQTRNKRNAKGTRKQGGTNIKQQRKETI